jgi:nitrogen regulatory protein PII
MVKIEIILDASWAVRLLETFESIGVKGYTVFETTEGKGVKGTNNPTGFSDVFDQKYIIAIVPEADANSIVEKITPVLTNAKGVVYSTPNITWLFPKK